MRKSLRKIKNESDKRRYRRVLSIRSKVSGTTECPRICLSKTNKHLQVQVIDDQQSKTLFSVQTFGKKAVKDAGKNVEGAKLVGVEVANGMKKHNLSKAVFDRRGGKYTGVIAALVQTIRDNGIQI